METSLLLEKILILANVFASREDKDVNFKYESYVGPFLQFLKHRYIF